MGTRLEASGGRVVSFSRFDPNAPRDEAGRFKKGDDSGGTSVPPATRGGHSAISHAISRAVEDVTKPSQEEDDVTIPDHITGNSSQADFRKLSPEGQERVRNPKLTLSTLVKTPEVIISPSAKAFPPPCAITWEP